MAIVAVFLLVQLSRLLNAFRDFLRRHRLAGRRRRPADPPLARAVSEDADGDSWSARVIRLDATEDSDDENYVLLEDGPPEELPRWVPRP